MLGGCDSEAEAPAQQHAKLSGPKQPLIGEIDRSQAGTQLPVLQLRDPTGQLLNMAALEGRPILINLWATWCAPCVVEMPALDRLAGIMGEDMKILTISQDLSGARVVEPFFADKGFTHLEPWLDPENTAATQIGGNILPVTILFDSGGQELFRVTGGYDWDSESAIAEVREAIAR